ncbi:MAG: outer membrane lipoprotein carrier protein LolA [Prevotella sp.]|nr:outer membrane lipoprotein carrier protein LolA [Prevotella sp.]
MKNIIRIVILLLICSVNLLAQNGTVTIKSLTADFKQTKTMKMLGSSMVSTGKMCYASPDKLRWEYTTPYAYTLVMNGQKVMFKRNGRKDVMDTQKNKMFREIGRVMLGSVVVSSKQKQMEMPLSKQLRALYKSVTLYFNHSTHLVERIVMIEKNGDKTEIELKNVTLNKNISADAFLLR